MADVGSSQRFLKKARAEYDGYLLIEDDYTKESFRILYENFRDLNDELETLKTKVTNLETNVANLETDAHTH